MLPLNAGAAFEKRSDSTYEVLGYGLSLPPPDDEVHPFVDA